MTVNLYFYDALLTSSLRGGGGGGGWGMSTSAVL